MRIFKTLFSFTALIAAVLISSCQTDKTETPVDSNNPQINIENLELDLSAEGGDYTINLTVSNSIGDVKVNATSAAEWFTVKETTTTSVLINAAFNTEQSTRETTLTIKYPEAEDVVIAVRQAANDGDPYTFSVKDITYNKFTTDITAKNDDNYYVIYMSEVSYFQEMGIADEEALLLDDYNFFSQYAGAYGYTLFEFMDVMGLARQGDISQEWTSLVPAEQYVVYVYGVKFNEDGSDYTVTTPIYHEIVETPMNELSEVSFTQLITSLEGPKVSYQVTPHGYDGYYTTMIVDQSHDLFLDPSTVDPNYSIKIAQEWMKSVNSYMGYQGMSAEDIIAQKCCQGENIFEKVLLANSIYTVIILPIDIIDGLPMVCSHPTAFFIETGDVAQSDMTFEINLNACYTRVLDFTVTPSTDENYSILILNKSALEGYNTEEEIIDYAVNGYWLDEYQGKYNYYNCYLRPETEYSILVFGYYGGVATTGLTRLDVKTEAVAPAVNSVTGIVTHGPYDPVAIAELDPSYANLAAYADNFVMIHWLETENDDYSGVYHYIYDTATVESSGDQAVFDDLVYYSYYEVAADVGAFNTEYVIAGVVQDYRGNYSEMVYSEPFTYTTDQLRNAQEFLDIMNGDTRSSNAKVSIVGRKEIKALSSQR